MPPCQGGCREFEPRLPLHLKKEPFGVLFFCAFSNFQLDEARKKDGIDNAVTSVPAVPLHFKKEPFGVLFFCAFLNYQLDEARKKDGIDNAVTSVPAVPLHFKKEQTKFFAFLNI